MQRLTTPQLIEMLELQNLLNTIVNPSWFTAKYPWGRAIRVECAELSDYLGWKWWKKQEPNMAQAQIEVVDIWHFMLSMLLQGQGCSAKHAAEAWEKNLDFPELAQIQLLSKQFCLKGLTMHESVDILSAFASAELIFGALFEKVMIGTGLTWDELRTQYVAKNVLNVFRQRHGYKDGSYIKEWFGAEDNVWLEHAVIEAKTNGIEFTADDLMQRMEAAYKEVCNARRQGDFDARHQGR